MKNTKKAIVDAARELFSAKGYAAVRTKEIAKLAGVNETTLFRHYESKEKLFKSIILNNIKEIDSDKIFHNSVNGDIERDLLMVTNQLFMLYKANAQIIKMIMKSIIEDNETLSQYSSQCRGGHIKKQLLIYFEEAKRSGVIEGDASLITDIYMSCINGYLFNAFVLEDRKPNLDYLIKMTTTFIKFIKKEMEG